MKPKPKTEPETPVTPQEPPASPALLSFVCLHCDHDWHAKAKPLSCPACRMKRFWIPAPKVSTLPELYYAVHVGRFHMKLPSGDYLPLDKDSAKMHLKRAGGDFLPNEGSKNVTTIEEALCVAQTDGAVWYAGRLSGHKRGLHTLPSGQRILVTSENRPPAAKKGPWDNLRAYLTELAGTDKKQFNVFLAWLASARRHQFAGTFQPGHALALAGESNAGKSFFTEVVERMLGGGSASCLDYMQGARFNDFLAESPLWTIDDKATDTSFRKRQQMGASLKQACVVPKMNIEGKGTKMFIASTFRRVLFLFNRTPEAVQVHPELTPDVRDKSCVLLTGRAILSAEWEENMAMLRDELPGFLYYLDRWEVPAAMKQSGWCPCPLCREAPDSDAKRFGFMAYHNTELVTLMSSISADENLWAIIRQVLWPRGKGDLTPWQGTALELEEEIDKTNHRESKRSLTGWTGGFAATLGKLAAKKDGRIVKGERDGQTEWTILPK